jgi:hypothetical protein
MRDDEHRPLAEIARLFKVSTKTVRRVTEGHRYFLAAFFAGDALRASGGQSKSAGDPIKQAVARHYIARRSQKVQKESIYAEIMDRFKIKSRQTVITYLNELGKKNWKEGYFKGEMVEHGLREIAALSNCPDE